MDIRKAARRAPFKPHSWVSAQRPLPAETDTGFVSFVEELAAAGLDVPEIDRWRELAFWEPPGDPADPESWMALDPEGWEAHLSAAAHVGVLRDGYRHAIRLARRGLGIEYRRLLAGHADALIGQLRPEFDAAADVARDLVAAGVRPGDTAEQLMLLGEQTSRAWLDFKNHTAGVLTRLAHLRMDMSAQLGIAPTMDHSRTPVDFSAAFTAPYSPGVFAVEPGEAPHSFWLRMAGLDGHRLELVPVADLDEFTVQTAAGVNLLAAIDEVRARQARDGVRFADPEPDPEPPGPLAPQAA